MYSAVQSSTCAGLTVRNISQQPPSTGDTSLPSESSNMDITLQYNEIKVTSHPYYLNMIESVSQNGDLRFWGLVRTIFSILFYRIKLSFVKFSMFRTRITNET